MKTLEQLDLKKKRYCIFDMDGTLIDSIGVYNQVDKQLLRDFGNVEIDLMDIQKDRDDFLNGNVKGDIYVLYCEYLIQKYNLGIKDPSVLSELRFKISTDILNQLPFKKNVPELLYLLSELGYILVLATMTSSALVDVYASQNENMTRYMNIKEFFDYVITKDEVVHKKPHPEIYEKIIKHYNCKKEECVIFEDSYTGVLACHHAGVDCVNVYDAYADVDRDAINQLTNYSIKDYEEMIGYVKKVYQMK